MLWQEVEQIKNQLDKALSTCRENGIKWAEAERNYRIAKSKEELRLRAEGVPVTLIPDIVKGLEEVANMDFERNVRLVTYKANVEAMLVKKLELKTMESELEREYGNINKDA